MLTFFTAAKPFRGATAVHQRNALRSWQESVPGSEVLLFGDEGGSAEAAAELGLRHFPDVPRNAYGTPLLDAIFATAQREARHPVLCYANADIVLLPAFAAAVRRLAGWPRFAMVGRRVTIAIDEPIDFASGWEKRFQRAIPRILRRGRGSALDYFAFRRGVIGEMPPFVVGRPAWDNWLVAHLRRSGVPLVDATPIVFAIHARHGYGHVAAARGDRWEGPEADVNRALAAADIPEFRAELYTTWSAGWLLLPNRTVPALTRRHLSSRVRMMFWETRANARAALRRWRKRR